MWDSNEKNYDHCGGQRDAREVSGMRTVCHVTASPELRGEHKRASPLAFSAAPHHQRKRKKDKDRPLQDAPSSSPDIRSKCKLPTHRQHPAQKVDHNTPS